MDHPTLYLEANHLQRRDATADFDVIWKSLQRKFDHIMSFYCLHWIQNLEKAAKNMYNLLEENGDCLFVFLASHVAFDAYKELSYMSKWQPYMKDVDKFMAPYHNFHNAQIHFQNLLYSAGFTYCDIELRHKMFVYENQEALRRDMRAISAFYSRMTPQIHEKFLDDYIKKVAQINQDKMQFNIDDFALILPYKLMIAYVRK